VLRCCTTQRSEERREAGGEVRREEGGREGERKGRREEETSVEIVKTKEGNRDSADTVKAAGYRSMQ
jgi:hypothetical protein